MPIEIKPPQVVAHVVSVATLELEFGFTMRERKSRSLDQLQVDALKVEENFTSAGKSRGKHNPHEKKRGKEEASSFGQGKESPDLKWEEMKKLIKSLLHKVVKFELKNKNLPKQNAQGNNRGHNPQYRRAPWQILQREIKYQLDRISPPLYLEDDPNEQTPDKHET